MSYQVLARKWRPQNFKEMVGQNHVLKALINALEEQRLHHAYLFTGTRGVGKTTIARILAKSLNCEKGISSEPCGQCSACCEIAEGRFVDLIEVDAASRTKVEDTRDLLDNVQYAPTRGRFKVYLIDEVHMLSNHSFNALLKTLEEPPPHVKFLFATTDPQKLPATILSRCLQFNLKRMTVDTISQHLIYILGKESVAHTETAVKQIARAADGSMRDALSLMDQAIAFGAGELKDSEVQDMLGGISHEHLFTVLEAVIEGKGVEMLAAIDEMASSTPDYAVAADTLISLLHQITITQLIPDAMQDEDKVKHLANMMSPEDVQLYYQIALHGRRDLPLSPDPRSGFEMILLRMLAFRPMDMDAVEDLSASKKKTLNNTQNVTQDEWVDVAVEVPAIEYDDTPDAIPTEVHYTEADIPPTPPMPEQIPHYDTPNKVKQTPVVAKEIPQSRLEIADWNDIFPQLGLKGMAAELARHCVLDSYKEGVVDLLLHPSGEQLHIPTTEAQLCNALEQYYAKSIKLSITLQQSTEQLSQVETPSQKAEREGDERQQAAEQEIYNDPFVKMLQEQFSAQIVKGSIKPIVKTEEKE